MTIKRVAAILAALAVTLAVVHTGNAEAMNERGIVWLESMPAGAATYPLTVSGFPANCVDVGAETTWCALVSMPFVLDENPCPNGKLTRIVNVGLTCIFEEAAPPAPTAAPAAQPIFTG